MLEVEAGFAFVAVVLEFGIDFVGGGAVLGICQNQ